MLTVEPSLERRSLSELDFADHWADRWRSPQELYRQTVSGSREEEQLA